MCFPIASRSCCATSSSRTLNAHSTGMTPGTDVMASSPSYVLQIQPFSENFWRIPARSPSEKSQVSAAQV